MLLIGQIATLLKQSNARLKGSAADWHYNLAKKNPSCEQFETMTSFTEAIRKRFPPSSRMRHTLWQLSWNYVKGKAL